MFNTVVIFSENPASINDVLTFDSEAQAKSFITALIKTFNSVQKSDYTDAEIDEILESKDKQFYFDDTYIIELKKTTDAKKYVIENDYHNFSNINYFAQILDFK